MICPRKWGPSTRHRRRDESPRYMRAHLRVPTRTAISTGRAVDAFRFDAVAAVLRRTPPLGRLRFSADVFISFPPLDSGPTRLHHLQESRMNTGNNDICFCRTVTPVEVLMTRITRCWRKDLLLVADPFQGISPHVL